MKKSRYWIGCIVVLGMVCSLMRHAVLWIGLVPYRPVMRITRSWNIHDPFAHASAWLTIPIEIIVGGSIALLLCMLFANPKQYEMVGLKRSAVSGMLGGVIVGLLMLQYAHMCWLVVFVAVVGVVIGGLVGYGWYAHADLYRAFGANASVIMLVFFVYGAVSSAKVTPLLIICNGAALIVSYFAGLAIRFVQIAMQLRYRHRRSL